MQQTNDGVSMRTIHQLSVFLLSIFVLAACTSGGDAGYPYPGPTTYDHVGRTYVLTTIYGDAVLPDNAPTIMFNGSDLSGKGYCNQYSGPYTGDAPALVPGQIAMTEMACADPTLMLLDSRYMTALAEVRSLRLDATTLTLANADGTAVLVYLQQGE
jgi:heat shock protein HslJ